MPTLLPVPPRLRSLTIVVCGAVLLAGCTVDLESTPEPTATATAVTFDPGDVSVDTLLNEGSVAWDSVETWISDTRIDTPSAGSGESASSSVSTERVILPNERHVLTTNGDTIVSEEIALGGTIYMRGTMVSSSIYPDADPESWISFTPDQAPPGTVLEQRVDYLTASPAYPFADVTADTRALPASPDDPVTFDDRECEAWSFTTPVADQEGLRYSIAFDTEGRPCQLAREGGGVVETTTWEYPAEPEPITAPANAIPVDDFPSAPS